MTIAPKRRFVDLSTDAGFFALLTESYARLVGAPLVPPAKDADWLYREAPFVVVAHGTDQDPKFIYANKAAQKCFEYSWEEFMSLPSRLSAEVPDRAERQSLLDEVARNGFLSGYQGLRVAKSGRRFIIEDGVVWELLDRDGMGHGQAATFLSWRDV
ncbi:MAG: MEKHLA domain-containing protein [Methyloceanibacter sp.]